ncbi:uncharacterized protein TNCV_4196081 [Trichonephila clavipes]|nr:uncharacterized protein TNCV_4196081 [Trichonephila clavipes]
MHPPYSRNLAPSDYHLFLALQNFLSHKKLGSREDCENRLLEFLANKDQDFYERDIMKIPLKWKQIIQQNENVKSGKGPLTPAGLLKLVKRFEETGKLEDRARARRPCLKEARAPCIAVEMEAITSEAASGTSSAREAARRLGFYHHHLSAIFFVESSSCTHTNCNRAMNFCQQIPHRGKHLRSGPSLKWNRIPPGFLTSCGEMKLISRFMVTLTTITVAFERPLIHCPVNGWITETVIAHRYLTLLRETVMPCLIQRGQISNVTFMQDGATSHTANPVKAFLIQTFGEDRIVSRHCRYPWPPRSPDLTPADFWL